MAKQQLPGSASAGAATFRVGQPGRYDHPDVAGPMQKILELCQKYQVPFGTTASGPEAARAWIQRGAQFFETTDELSLIVEGGKRLVSEYRQFCS